MPTSERLSAKDFTSGPFAPHGAMDIQVAGRLNVLEAKGPFNLELVLAGDVAQEQLDTVLNARGRWGTVLVLKGSALASPEAISEIARIVQRRVELGIRPVAFALVVGPEVEGGALMQSHYLSAYASAGIPGRAFADLEQAKLWVLQIIDGAEPAADR